MHSSVNMLRLVSYPLTLSISMSSCVGKYETQQSTFNYFLICAISAIFLAVCHAPAEFSHSCRAGFYSALGILKDLSSRSFSSKRLWKSIRGLTGIAPKLGLSPTGAATQKTGNVNNAPNDFVLDEANLMNRHRCNILGTSSNWIGGWLRG